MTPDLHGAFRALADPTRRQILVDLSTSDMTIGEVVDRFDMTRGAVKKHLIILEEGKLISVRSQGRARINRLEPLGLKSVLDWVNYFNRFWDDRLGDLKNAIENEKREESIMSDSTITKTVFLAASRETVWSFLTDRKKLTQWFHPAEADLAEGQDYALMGKAEDGSMVKQCWGTVLHMDPPAAIVYSFTIKPLDGAMTTVSWALEEAHGGTKLTLRHEGIGAAAGEPALGLLMALDAGWDSHLGSLRAALA